METKTIFMKPSELDSQSLEILTRSINEHFKDTPKEDIPNKFRIVIELTASEVRRAYVEGKVSAEMAKDYDLFNCKKTTAYYEIENNEINTVYYKNEY